MSIKTESMLFLGNRAEIDTVEGSSTGGANYGVENDIFGGTTLDVFATGLGVVDLSADYNDASNRVFEDDRVFAGTDPGTLTYTKPDGTAVTDALDAVIVYGNSTVTYKDGTSESVTLILIQAQNGDVFVEQPTASGDKIIDTIDFGPTAGSGWGWIPAEVDWAVCFTAATLIQTDRGEIAVEELKIGDMVKTLDHGYQPIRWIGSNRIFSTHKTAPILIKKGALDNTRDLKVSPQHRMYIQDWRATILFEEDEVLIPAKALINDDTIVQLEQGEVEYFHIMLDAHELIFADGAIAESLYLGKSSYATFSAEQRQEIQTIFPQLFEDNDLTSKYSDPSRKMLSYQQAKVLVAYS